MKFRIIHGDVLSRVRDLRNLDEFSWIACIFGRSDLGSRSRRMLLPGKNFQPMTRRLVRGIDHAGVIASGVAEELALPICRPLYQAGGRTQVSRTPSARERPFVSGGLHSPGCPKEDRPTVRFE